MSSSTLPLINTLKQPTRWEWVEQALTHLNIILLDHSHCERKAAGVALNLMFRYPSNTKLVRELTAIAREELEHFEQVNQWLERRGIPLGPLSSPPYGARLKALMRKDEPERLLDSLLVSGLIEARSHERLGLLATHCPDCELAEFYLGKAEGRRQKALMEFWLLPSARDRREQGFKTPTELLFSGSRSGGVESPSERNIKALCLRTSAFFNVI